MSSSSLNALVIALPAILTPQFAAAVDWPKFPSHNPTPLIKQFEFFDRPDAQVFNMPHKPGAPIETAQIISVYREGMNEANLTGEDAFSIKMPIFYKALGGIEDMLFRQSLCMKPNITSLAEKIKTQETDVSVGLRLQKWDDNSLDITFTKGPYSGVGILYSRPDRAAVINYSGVTSHDGTFYNFPDHSFVSQMLYSQDGALRQASANNKNEDIPSSSEFIDYDISELTISGELDKGYIRIDAQDGSSFSINMEDGAMKTEGVGFGVAYLTFTPGPEVMRDYVMPLTAELSDAPFQSNADFSSAALCDPQTDIPPLQAAKARSLKPPPSIRLQ